MKHMWKAFLASLAGMVAMLGMPDGSARAQEAQAKGSELAAAATAARGVRQKLMRNVKSWGYQLRQINLGQIEQSPLDLVVIDHAVSSKKRFTAELEPDHLSKLKVKPDGSRRVVLGYMSIGEAEVYRFYWQADWLAPGKRPAWLADENPQWPGNYRVRFWDPAWQAIIFGNPDAYLDRMIAAGFDGIYLDRADVFADLGPANPAAEAEMVRFILRLAAYARERNPEFIVVMQNAEELIDHDQLLAALDGIAKEDLYFGINHDGAPNDPDTVSWTVDVLRRVRRAQRAVLVVEYLDDALKAREARRRATAERFVIHFAPRELGELRLVGPDEAPPPAAAP